MRFSLTTRLTLLIAAVIVIAFIVLAMIFHSSASRQFVESRIETKTEISSVSHQRTQLVEFVEEAFAEGGWDNVARRLSQPYSQPDESVRSIGAGFPGVVIFDDRMQTRFATQGSPGSANVTRENGGMFRLKINDSKGDDATSIELITSDTSLLKAPDGSELGRMIVLPEPVNADVGENFAGQVWRSAAGWLFLTLVISTLLTSIILRRSLKPVARLTEAASQLRDGEIPAQLNVEGDFEFRNLIEAFNAATRSIAKTDAIRKQLISDIAHELRTPLTNIKGQLEAADAGLISDEAEFQSTLRNETKLLERLVDDFQQLAISDAGQLPIHPQVFPLAMLLRDTLTPFAEQASATLRLEIPDDTNVWADDGRIRQVFGNLMDNSARHQPQGLVVTVKAERLAEDIIVTFSDNGPGIAKADQPFIFDRFYRAEKSRNRLTGGSGLGLSIARALVEAMDGSICFVPTIDTGATFRITLPANNARSTER